MVSAESEVSVGDKQEKWIKHYSSSHEILLVGEGDFSFAACLARSFGNYALNMVATSHDCQEMVVMKHPSSVANLKELREYGCTIVHEVDALTMSQHPLLNLNSYDRIVFNFPHARLIYREHDVYQIVRHQKVVRGFMKNARNMLAEKGQVHVTHKTSYPFSKWEIVKLGKEVGLQLVEEAEFKKWDYPGYHNKRGGDIGRRRCNKTFPVGACSTFKFAKP